MKFLRGGGLQRDRCETGDYYIDTSLREDKISDKLQALGSDMF